VVDGVGQLHYGGRLSKRKPASSNGNPTHRLDPALRPLQLGGSFFNEAMNASLARWHPNLKSALKSIS
jgi:hypothetical protein